MPDNFSQQKIWDPTTFTVQHPEGLFRVVWDTPYVSAHVVRSGYMTLERYPDRTFRIFRTQLMCSDGDKAVFSWEYVQAESLAKLARNIQAHLMEQHIPPKQNPRPEWTMTENWIYVILERYWVRSTSAGRCVHEVVLEEDSAYTRYGIANKIDDVANERLYAYALRDQVFGLGRWFPKVDDLVAFLRERLWKRAFHEAALKGMVQKATQDLGQGLRDLKDRRIAELEKDLSDLNTKVETVLEALRKENAALCRQINYNTDTIQRLQAEITMAAQRIATLDGSKAQ